jgi:hypothetical protein
MCLRDVVTLFPDMVRQKSVNEPLGDYENLEPLYQQVHEAIREEDTKKIIFFESITWDNWKVGFQNVPGKLIHFFHSRF